MNMRLLRVGAIGSAMALLLSGCGFSPYNLPLPVAPISAAIPTPSRCTSATCSTWCRRAPVKVNDIAVGKVTDIKLNGWTAVVTIKVNRDSKLPDNAEATIRQTSLLGEKFVSLAPPNWRRRHAEQRRHDSAWTARAAILRSRKCSAPRRCCSTAAGSRRPTRSSRSSTTLSAATSPRSRSSSTPRLVHHTARQQQGRALDLAREDQPTRGRDQRPEGRDHRRTR